ncbi:hypothetical protein CHLRE_06g294600v5 [Chlamydomonas reinhardtii]|uniref:RING-type domain-containing protein n=1 Tax=Chlamydomonas reinhardtii TaxID=3055 RepID=A0A2K3DQH3_CHLRE|nr:uncharacterized protein CHLRE_06g294600v5 [Chlamydomonas reinhardtii]PNW82796.1 hypothetical protein CHLRE_06g294600v5 [Chlamydomonas reinhardtii]
MKPAAELAAAGLAPAGPVADSKLDLQGADSCPSQPSPSSSSSSSVATAAAAEAAAASEAVSDSLQCPICCDLLLLPVVTACGHAYCLDCFEAWRLHAAATYHTVGSLLGRLHCPVCRSPLPRHFNAGPALPGAGGRAGRAIGRSGRSSSGFLSAAMAASAAAAVVNSSGGVGSSSCVAAAAAPPLVPCAALGDAIAALCPARYAERLARRQEQLQQLQRLQELKPQAAGSGQDGQRHRGRRHGARDGDRAGGGGGGTGGAAAGAGEPWQADAATLLERSGSGASASSSGGFDARAPQPHDLVGLPWPLRALAAPWRRLAGAARRASHGLRRLLPPPLPGAPWHGPTHDGLTLPQPSALEVLVTLGLVGIYLASCGCIALAVLEDVGAAMGRGLNWLRRRRSQPRLWRRLAAAVAAALGGGRHRRRGVSARSSGGGGGGDGAAGLWRRGVGSRSRPSQQRALLPPWPFAWPSAGGLLPLGLFAGGNGVGGGSGGGGTSSNPGSGGLLSQVLQPQHHWAARQPADPLIRAGGAGSGSSGGEEEGLVGGRRRRAVCEGPGAGGMLGTSRPGERSLRSSRGRAQQGQQQLQGTGQASSRRASLWAARAELLA